MDRELRELHQGHRNEQRRLVPDADPCPPTEPDTIEGRLEAAGFEGVDVTADRTFGDRRKVVLWVDREAER